MQRWSTCEFLELFTEEMVFVTKLNDITTFRIFQGREHFLLVPEKIKSSLAFIGKIVFKNSLQKNAHYSVI